MLRTAILGVGHHVPSKVVTNDDLAKMFETSDEWIQQRTGIKERRYIDHVPCGPSDLAVPAVKMACERAKIDVSEIDAIIFAERTADARYTLRFTKRRWRACASASARGTGQAGTGPERAAKARASPPEVESDDEPPSNEATSLLPERLDAPYALLLRSWPWTQGVRVTTIIAAWRSDESSIQGLCTALRELTGTTDDSIPSAIKIGNALRWARGHSLNGMTLTCEHDRMKVAIWRVVREG